MIGPPQYARAVRTPANLQEHIRTVAGEPCAANPFQLANANIQSKRKSNKTTFPPEDTVEEAQKKQVYIDLRVTPRYNFPPLR